MNIKIHWIVSMLFFGILLTIGGSQLAVAQQGSDATSALSEVTLDVTGMT